MYVVDRWYFWKSDLYLGYVTYWRARKRAWSPYFSEYKSVESFCQPFRSSALIRQWRKGDVDILVENDSCFKERKGRTGERKKVHHLIRQPPAPLDVGKSRKDRQRSRGFLRRKGWMEPYGGDRRLDTCYMITGGMLPIREGIGWL